MPLDMVKDGHLGGYVHGGDPATWCPNLWRWLVERFDVRSVLDIGCGEGYATRFFRELGCDVLGVDGCEQAIRDSVIPECVTRHDFCDGPFRAGRSFNLVWSCEFLEHVDQQYLPNILGTLACATKAIAVTHALPGQPGHHHVNCQRSSYWIRHVEPLKFTCDVGLTREARTTTLLDHPKINHYARGGLLFVRDAQTLRRGGQQPSAWETWKKDLQINLGFRLSSAYRRQRSTYRRTKRDAQRQAA